MTSTGSRGQTTRASRRTGARRRSPRGGWSATRTSTPPRSGSSRWTAGAQPRQFTAGKKRDLAPRWSPDGTRLAFISNREGESKQLFVIPVEGGEPLRLTELDEDVEEVTVVARLQPARLQLPRARPGVRRGGRRSCASRAGSPALHSSSTASAGSATGGGTSSPSGRRLAPPSQLTDGDYEDRRPGLVAGREEARLRLGPPGRTGTSSSVAPPLRGRRGRRRAAAADRGRGPYSAPVCSPDGSQIACRFSPRTARLSASTARSR